MVVFEFVACVFDALFVELLFVLHLTPRLVYCFAISTLVSKYQQGLLVTMYIV